MTQYNRVIPRDLFNEASLLKCLGKVYINLETSGTPLVKLNHDGRAFDIRQDDSSGAIHARNVTLHVRDETFRLYRPLNSRDVWPLYLDVDDMTVEVFDSQGAFSQGMMEFLRGGRSQ